MMIRAISSPAAILVTAAPALSRRAAVPRSRRAVPADRKAAQAVQVDQEAHRAAVLPIPKAATPNRWNSRHSARMKCRLSRMIDYVFIFQI